MSGERNYWLDEKCACAFWDQHKAIPYQELLEDTAQWLSPAAGERWLDLGCGRGELTAVLWQKSHGELTELIAMDCNAVNARAIDRLQRRLSPAPRTEQLRFANGNFSAGLPQFETASFDGIVSGLAISYAESKDLATGRFTDTAYNRLLMELNRVLKPGGRLVFSVNVPHPRFWRIFWRSLRLGFRVSKPAKSLLNALRMQWYGHWLKREAQRGRFHFYPAEEIAVRLERAGFVGLQCRLSYAGQAYLIAASKLAA